MTAEAELRAAAEAWIADDPDAGDRAELRALLDRAFPAVVLPGCWRGGCWRDRRIAGPLRGPARLRDGRPARRGRRGPEPDEPRRGQGRDRRRGQLAARAGFEAGGRDSAGSRVSVVVGCDARHRSAEFAGEVAGVLAGAGIAVHVLPLPCPTPLLAFAVRHLGAAAGVMVTASHNPAADNGYKLYLSDGAQVIPPADAEIEQLIAGLGPLSQIPVAGAGEPADHPPRRRGGAGVPGRGGGGRRRAGPPGPRPGELNVVYTPMHGVAGPSCCAPSGRRASRRRTWWPRRRSPTGLPDGGVFQPGGAGSPGPGAGRRAAARR